ncbi:MAG: hypothetical protein J1E64_04560 [Acetatifactor sp.]|nr:hypothetical protein [Acetatifactor sp.]
MAICKCRVRPRQGNFEVGRYYTWYYAVTKTQLKPKSVRDAEKENFQFSPGEYSYYFKDIEFAYTNIAIYIDRKKELLFVPEFRYEEGFGVSLSYFNRLSVRKKGKRQFPILNLPQRAKAGVLLCQDGGLLMCSLFHRKMR